MMNLNSLGLSSLQSKIQELIYNIRNSKLDQIKQNSISNIHSKIQAKLISHQKLPIQLPSVLMQWINDHQDKTLVLLRALQIINYYTKNNFGIQILRQFEALQYFQGFRSYLVSTHGMEEYQKIVDNIIQNLLPFGYEVTQKQQNISKLGNVNNKESYYPERQIQNKRIQDQQNIKTKQLKQTIKENHKVSNLLLPKNHLEHLQFTICFEDTEEIIEKTLFDLSVQLRYGNIDVKYQTLRSINDILVQNPCANFRNKSQLIKQLQQCILKKVWQNQAIDTLILIFKGLLESTQLYNQSIKSNPKSKPIKFLFPIKHNYFQNPFMQPLMALISDNFNKQWIQWLLPLKHNWTFPYIFKIINKLPHQIIQSSMIQQLLKNILSTTQIDYDSLSLENNIIDLNKFQSFQIKQSYNHIKQFQNDIFEPLLEQQQNLVEIIQKLKLGIEGLAYNPQLVINYVETSMCIWYRHLEKLPLGEYHSTMLDYLLEISSHSSQPVRLRLYQILLQKAYTQQVNYENSSKSISQIILSLIVSDTYTLYELISNSLDQKDTCLKYMLQILKVLYTFHQKTTHEIIKQISPFLNVFSIYQNDKISNLSKYLLSRLNKKQLLVCDLMNLFSKDRKTRINTSSQVFNLNIDIIELFDVNKPPKKTLKIDEDCIINYIINVSNKDLKISIRIGALTQLIQSIRRAELTSLIHNRLHSLNQLLIKQLMELVNQDTQQQVWIGYILHFTLQLYLKHIINIKQLPSPTLLVLMMKAYYTGKCKQLISSIIGLIYIICFKNPFSGKNSSIHWYYLNIAQFTKILHLQLKQRKICTIKQPLKSNKSKSKSKSDQNIPKINQTKKYMQYIYTKLQNPDTYELKFQQVEQIISKSFVSNNPSYSFSLIKSLFVLYNQNKSKFKKLSQQFQHLISPLINYLNRQTNKYIEDDILTIIKIIGIKTQKQAQSLLNNKKIQLRCLDLAKNIPKETVQSIIRVLPQQSATLSKVFKSLLIKNSFKQVTSEIGLISLCSSLQKSIKNKNKKLKLFSLQALFSILTLQFIQKNTSFFTLIIEQLEDKTLNPICVLLCLRILKQILTLYPDESLLQTIQHSNLISTSIQWLQSNKNILIKIGCVQLLNSITNTFLVESYDLTATFINQINFNFQQQANSNNQHIILQIMIVYESLSGILFLSSHTQRQQYINYLLSTQLLYYILKNITTIQLLIAPKLKNNSYLSQTIDIIGSMLLFLSQSQDLFIMHLNKLTVNNPKMIYTLSNLIECSTQEYSNAVVKLINLWNKSHKYLNQSQLGANILNSIVQITNNNYQLVSGLLAISQSAKVEFINKGYYRQYLQQSLITIDQVIVFYLSSQNKTKSTINKKKNISNISMSIQTPKDTKDLYEILKFLKSFFHPTQCQKQQGSKPKITNQLSSMSVDLLSKLQECCRIYPQITKQFKKLLCNLFSSSSQFHKVMSELIDPKHSLVKDLIQASLKQNPEDIKQSLQLLSILGRQSQIRTIIFRNKLISQLNSKILKNWEQRKNVDDMMLIIFQFYLHLSVYQDAQQKLVTDKKILDLTLIQLQKSIQNYQSQLPTLILKLLCNISYSKHNKPLLINNRDFHKTILTLITSQNVQQKLKIYLGQTLYNVLYKSAEAIGIYKKQKVLDELKFVGVGKGQQLREVMNKIIKVLNTQFK